MKNKVVTVEVKPDKPIKPAIKPIVKVDPVQESIDTHAEFVDIYNSTSHTASQGYPEPLTYEQREAYMMLPDLIEGCKAAWAEIPEDLRSAHYLLK